MDERAGSHRGALKNETPLIEAGPTKRPTELMTLGRILPAALVCLATALFAVQAPAATKPNVVVILSDDQGWGDLSV
jgi:hypothetical protein